MGTYTAMAAALPAVNMGEGPLVDLPLSRWKRTCGGDLHQRGQPHCVTIVPEVDSLEAGADRPGF